jgi:hypothetical protein
MQLRFGRSVTTENIVATDELEAAASPFRATCRSSQGAMESADVIDVKEVVN